MKKLIFYRCNHCGNVAVKLVDKNTPLICCGEKMQELIPNDTDAAFEKHVPLININGDNVLVKIGSEPHPMSAEHYIQFIVIETNRGFKIVYLEPNDVAEATFVLSPNEQTIAVYAYCNLHSLWVKDAV